MPHKPIKEAIPDFLLKLYHILEVDDPPLRNHSFLPTYAGLMRVLKSLSKMQRKWKSRCFHTSTDTENYHPSLGK